MTFPSVDATNSGIDNTSSTSHNISLPASIAAGDLLIIFITSSAATSVASATGWTSLYSTSLNLSIRGYCLYKIADGSEGSSVTVSFTVTCSVAWTSYRISGYASAPEVGTSATGTSTTPDPPSLTPSWGSDDTLWIAAAHCNNVTADLTAPTNYGSIVQAVNGGGKSAGTAQRNLAAASDDPGTFANASNNDWVANVVAVRPSSGVKTATMMHSYRLRRAA